MTGERVSACVFSLLALRSKNAPARPLEASNRSSKASWAKERAFSPSPPALEAIQSRAWRRRRRTKKEKAAEQRRKQKSHLFSSHLVSLYLSLSLSFSFDQRRVPLFQAQDLGEALLSGGRHLGPGLRRKETEGKRLDDKSERISVFFFRRGEREKDSLSPGSC